LAEKEKNYANTSHLTGMEKQNKKKNKTKPADKLNKI